VVEQAQLAKAQGWFNVVGGLWPLLSMRTFELLTGPKADRWLVRTVAGLLVANGVTQLSADSSPEALRAVRTLGRGTSGALAVVDLVYASRGRISKVYLVDAAAELAWVVLWSTAKGPSRARSLLRS
jgi:hypothetical protein